MIKEIKQMCSALKRSYKNKDFYKQTNNQIVIPEDRVIVSTKNKSGEIEVVDETTIEAIIRNKGENQGVLNFANGLVAGGGCLLGAKCQEESLMRNSNLYPYLLKEVGYYFRNWFTSYWIGLEKQIVTKKVYFFNGEEDIEVDTVVTIGAVNQNYIFGSKAKANSLKIMEDRIRNIINSFEEQDSDVIILGAFGCGAYRNDPNLISDMFYKILIEEKKSLCFNKVIFSIPKGENLDIFKKKFM